jgi:hypothetical protein
VSRSTIVHQYLKAFREYRIEVKHRRTGRWRTIAQERCPVKARQVFDGWIQSYPDFALRLIELPTRKVLRKAP